MNTDTVMLSTTRLITTEHGILLKYYFLNIFNKANCRLSPLLLKYYFPNISRNIQNGLSFLLYRLKLTLESNNKNTCNTIYLGYLNKTKFKDNKT